MDYMPDFWELLAGIGIFLFGIYQLEVSLDELAGRAFRRLIRRYTDSRIKAIASGILSTSILQSSSAVTLMLLAFVGAGMMSFTNALGVILGTNIGTTVTAWIVAVFGFKISIESIALPLIGLGGLGLVLLPRQPRYLNISKLLVGFGFLFLGIDYMKFGVEQLTTRFDLSSLAGLGTAGYLLIGIVLTALMQSSSAMITIVLAGMYGGLIGFEAGAVLVIGANIGTTITIIVGSLGGVPIKRRVAYSHFIFNVSTGAVALLLLPLYTLLIQDGLGWGEETVLGIALFHTLFNLTGLLLFLPLIPRVTSLLSRLVPESKRILTLYIQNTPAEIPEAAIRAFCREILYQLSESRNYVIRLLELEEQYPASVTDTGYQPSHIERYYEQIKALHAEIFEYQSVMQSGRLEPEESKEIERYLRASRSIMNAVKNFKTVHDDLEAFAYADSSFLNEQADALKQRIVTFYRRIDTITALDNSDSEKQQLQQLMDFVEQEDHRCIAESTDTVRSSKVDHGQLTSLLMVNRLITQSFRMIIYSLRTLLGTEDKGDEV